MILYSYSVLFTCFLIVILHPFHGLTLECDKSSYPPPSSSEVIEEYVIDLDGDPEFRWKDLIIKKSETLKQLFGDVRSLVEELFGSRIYNLVNDELPRIAESLPSPYFEELKGMSRFSGLSLAHVTMYNIFYEMFVLCTSIIAQDERGNLYHGRNLDNGALLGWNSANHSWVVTELLKPLTVVLDWRKGGDTVFRSVSFAGYMGILTAVKKDKFSFSLDKRMALNNGIVGLLEWMLFKDHKQHWVSFLSREVMENAQDFEEAKAALSKPKLMAPVYYILAGVKPGQGVIITRDRDNVNLLPLNSATSQYDSWFLVETNYDHWKRPPFYDDRRTPSVTCLEEGGRGNASFKLLYNVLSTKPVLNKSTVYTALMQAKSGTIRAWKRTCPDPCFPW